MTQRTESKATLVLETVRNLVCYYSVTSPFLPLLVTLQIHVLNITASRQASAEITVPRCSRCTTFKHLLGGFQLQP